MPPVPSRLVYFLNLDAKCRLEVSLGYTRVLKWSEFRRWDHRLEEIMRKSAGRPVELASEDRRIVMRLLQFQTPDQITATLDGIDGFELAQLLVSTGRAFWSKGNQLRLQPGDAIEVEAVWKENREGLPQPFFASLGTRPNLAATTPPLLFRNDGKLDRLHPLTGAWSAAALRAWICPPLSDEAAIDHFQAAFTQRFPEVAQPARPGSAPPEDALEILPVPQLRWMLREDELEGKKAGGLFSIDQIVVLRVRFRYGDKSVDWHDDRPRVGMRMDGVFSIVARSTEFESAVLDQLRRLGFAPRVPDPSAGLFDFYGQDWDRAKDAEHPLETQIAALASLAETEDWALDQAALSVSPDTAANWSAGLHRDKKGLLHYAATFQHAGHEIALLPLLRDFLRTHRDESNEALEALFTESTFALQTATGNPPIVIPGESLRLLFRQLFELRSNARIDRQGHLRVSKWRASELVETAEAAATRAPSADEEAVVSPAIIEARQRWREQLISGDASWPEWNHLPEHLTGLRGYQRSALGWMRFLRETDTHGILADDMGLGKTFQVLAHLACEQAEGLLDGPVLIVCPTSVLDNWTRESQLRTPSLVLRKHHGPQRPRNREAIVGGAAGIVTSYALLREDARLLTGIEWAYAILDEAQAIKNFRSETHRVATALQARRRLCISGTPIENHLGELWALFEFLLPDHLGTREAFREDYESPVAEAQMGERTRLLGHLRRRVRPFILRRTKEVVAPELPAKTEIVHYVEMTPAQAQCYEASRLSTTKDLRRIFEARGLPQSRLHVLEALTRLRLICCDPRLGGDSEEHQELRAADSAKLRRLLQLLDELIDEGRRCLVFSQFTKVLDLIEPELTKRAWNYLRLDGSTRDRGPLLEAFEGGEAPIFLLSLRAGGTGLNLTSADTVIHFDPWWNPAVEDQATDRVHRLGQDKPVFVHRLVTSDTVEAGIIELHSHKRGLARDLLDFHADGPSAFDPAVLAKLLGEDEVTFSSRQNSPNSD